MTLWCNDAIVAGPGWPGHQSYQKACDMAFAELTLESNFLPFLADTPTVICVVKNEERRLPVFLAHYQALGAQNIHIIDNGSSDRTAEIAKSYSGVTLWSTSASYANSGFGQLWVGAVVRRFGLGRWVLNVDADELLVYPQMDVKCLKALQCSMEASGFERLYTPLVDLYLDNTADQMAGGDLGRLQFLFDGGRDHKYSYRFEDSIYGLKLMGGPRARMMAEIGQTIDPWLSKFSLARWESDTAYANVHFPYPFNRNPKVCFAALLHIKMLDDFSVRVLNAIREGEHFLESIEYKAYQQWLESHKLGTLVNSELSMLYEGPESLVKAGIIGETLTWG